MTSLKETQLFHMYKDLLHQINKAQSIKELTRFITLFSSKELKELIMNKLNVEIEKGQKNENSIEFFSIQGKIRDLYLQTASFDEILPTAVQAHIFSFLDYNSLEYFPFLSRSIHRTFCLNPILFEKYTLEFFAFGENTFRENIWENTLENILKENSSENNTFEENTFRKRRNIKHKGKIKKLCVKHKSECVVIGIEDPKISNGNVSTVDQLGQFPWYSIRKWHVNGTQLQLLYSYFAQRPVPLYQFLFDSSSDTRWKEFVSTWNDFIKSEESPSEKWNTLNYRDLTRINHGRIYYGQELLAQNHQIESLKAYIDKNILKRHEYDYVSDRPIFHITYDTPKTTFRSSQYRHRPKGPISVQSPFQYKDWKGLEKDLRVHILNLNEEIFSKKDKNKQFGYVDDAEIRFQQSVEQIQYFYDHILCIREWLESLFGSSENFKFGHSNSTSFQIIIVKKQVPLKVHENDTYKRNSLQVGDEFLYICKEGQLAMSNATQYIVFGELIDFTDENQNEKEISNNKSGNGWNIIDLLRKNNEIEEQQLSAIIPNIFLFWKKKIKYAKEQIDLFIAMLDKARKSIQSLAVTNTFDQLIIFPILPNLIHLRLKHIKIGSCFNSINVKGLMPQLKTLTVEKLLIKSCTYCNWQQTLEAAGSCDFNHNNDSLSISSSFPSFDPQQKQQQDISEIKFLNYLLLSCPNLLAFSYIAVKINPEDTLKIPSTVEWLRIEGQKSELCVQLDLSQCKCINGFSWEYCFIKWPTETVLKIGWLKNNNGDISYWDNLLSSNKCCNVQLCVLLVDHIIFDFTSDNSLFSQSPFADIKRLKQTVAKRSGIGYDNVDLLFSKDEGITVPNSLQKLMFQKIAEIMGIHSAKVKEYQKWFNIEEAYWIFNLFSAYIFNDI
ncbi:hypothetical protein RFI_06790 [Reticulomyxa filosa]|uniref:F-box domain-containing protein n=1 Tax=Reticulomyxa filosa TaxID=46433 RepID=X6NVI5_RETFI|nr:hypothetical protein RFI_06790 [Reticulomyxa filosa]|eukprot:ETO30325.1 hypothetical protein RFI_06790 [Reticulomyxa filosa]